MLLPLRTHQPSLPPQTPLKPSRPLLFFCPSPLSQYPSKSLLRTAASACADDTGSQALPHQSAIQRIADKLRSLGYVDDDGKDDWEDALNRSTHPESPGEIFVPLRTQLQRYRVGHTIDTSWSTPENPVPEPGSGGVIQRFHKLRREVWKEKKEKVEREGDRRERVPTLAELTLPKEELSRLRGLGIGLKKKLKVGKAGITEGIVNGIHERWRRTELVKIVCEDLCRMNMKRTHDLLERKTGGLVIWRSGSNIILYRGANYKYPYFLSDNNSTSENSTATLLDSCTDYRVDESKECFSSGTDGVNSAGPNSSNNVAQAPLIQGVGSPNRVRFQLPGEAQLVEEADHLLDGLGPRFTDWWGCEPLPIDADLLPAVVPRYRRPFRLLPYGGKPKLTNDEMTILRRLGRPLPCHFALGRNRRLQGLAAAIVKLWEKCEIAKIAVKRGVQNTNSELMAEELKWLTGGTLLSRDKEFIVLYRGKDFLPAAVSLAIEERRECGNHGEKHGTDGSSAVTMQQHKLEPKGFAFKDECKEINNHKKNIVSEHRKLMSAEAVIERTSTKLNMALAKKARAEQLLADMEKIEIPQQPEVDTEGITEEERYMLRKVGLRMKPFLLLGIRGVFDGTIENMHLHWKYRELVKIIIGARSIEKVHHIARSLEAESGGILVAVERVSKGYAIIVYRGKNYKRPATLRPQTLLNKRESLKRFKEAQRRESLKLHVLKLSRNIDKLKLQLARDEKTNTFQSDSKLQSVKELETNKMQLSENKTSYTNLEGDYCHLPVAPACNQENNEAGERYDADSSSSLDEGINSSRDNLETTKQNILGDFSSKYENEEEEKFDLTETEVSAKVVFKDIKAVITLNGEGGEAESPSPGNFKTNFSDSVNTHPHFNEIKTSVPSHESQRSESELLRNRTPLKAQQLSNQDRLLLRKQALKMKKRPVLAIGKSNIVTGVAKAIKSHFQKHPLAIVNVKGRAKGTSVREVVSKLEEATGAVLVSQEPSKVILYRGWGAGERPGQTVKKNPRDMGKTSAGREDGIQLGVSPELVSAIKLECGLQCSQVEQEAC